MRPILRLLPVIGAHRRLFLEAVLADSLVQLGALGMSLATAALTGAALTRGSAPSLPVVLALGALAVLLALATWRESWVSHDLAYRVMRILRGRTLDALRRALPQRSRARRSGDLATAVMADVDALEWLYAHTLAQSLSAAAVLAGCTTVSLVVLPSLLLVWVPLLVAGVLVTRAGRIRGAERSTRIAAENARMRAEVLDVVRGLRELRGAGALERVLERLDAEHAETDALRAAEARRIGAQRGASDALLAIAPTGAILAALALGDLPAHLVPLTVVLAVAALSPAARIGELAQQLHELGAASARITAVLDLPPAVEDSTDARRPAPSTLSRPVSVPAAPGGLILRGVTFSYAGERPVLRGADLDVRPGEVVALVGPSGCGKSTLAMLAQRMWDPDTGHVLLGGTDLRSLPDAELRCRIAAVGQGTPVVRGTIAENLRLARPDATDDQVSLAARRSGLLDPATGLPGGLATELGADGAGISGGQRARVAIARALVGEPEVLILDEAAAALDAPSAARILVALRETRTCAVLLIAHRPSTVALADRVVEVHEGRCRPRP